MVSPDSQAIACPLSGRNSTYRPVQISGTGSPNRITEIINNRRRITADTALRLSLYFGNSPEFWMNLQSHYDLKMARSDLKPSDIKRIRAQRAA
jgi:plasmid maintenance system antidote protein VapI